jgi:RNA polymerase sigma-70 factor (ECF subfamily)
LPTEPPHSTYSDEELLQYFRQTGDKSWLGTLLYRYTLLLLGVAMKYLKDKDAAQDAVQQIFLKALLHLPQGEIQNFKGWLYILMRNHCLQQLRDKTYPAPEEVLQYLPAAEDRREELILQEATIVRMREALQELPVDQRTCVAQFYLERKSYQQIMENTGFTFAQVKSHIQNGKRNLKIALEKKLAKPSRK